MVLCLSFYATVLIVPCQMFPGVVFEALHAMYSLPLSVLEGDCQGHTMCPVPEEGRGGRSSSGLFLWMVTGLSHTLIPCLRGTAVAAFLHVIGIDPPSDCLPGGVFLISLTSVLLREPSPFSGSVFVLFFLDPSS